MMYPGSGFLCLAIEAARQQEERSHSHDISGYYIQEMVVQQALVIPDTADGIEI